MTTKQLDALVLFHSEGYVDRQIADEIGIKECKVRYWRTKLGLAPNRTNKRFTVYDRKTSEFVFEGTLLAVCDYLGISCVAFRSRRRRFNAGAKGKYEIYEVEEGVIT